MKSPFSFAQWTQLALLCLSASTIAKAIPAAPASLETAGLDALLAASDPLPELDIDQINATTTKFIRRGCIPSRPVTPNNPQTPPQPGIELQDNPNWTCDGSIPSKEEILDQFRRTNKLGKKVSVFYTGFQNFAGRAIPVCKTWVAAHTDQIPCEPGWVMWDEIVENDWYLAVGNAISKAAKDEGKSVDRFQKYLSQLMAEESKGRAWVMAPKDVDFAQLKRKDEQEKKNAWSWWEYPALTQNPDITEIVRTDPSDMKTKPPSTTVIWRQGDPTLVPLGLNF